MQISTVDAAKATGPITGVGAATGAGGHAPAAGFAHLLSLFQNMAPMLSATSGDNPDAAEAETGIDGADQTGEQIATAPVPVGSLLLPPGPEMLADPQAGQVALEAADSGTDILSLEGSPQDLIAAVIAQAQTIITPQAAPVETSVMTDAPKGAAPIILAAGGNAMLNAETGGNGAKPMLHLADLPTEADIASLPPEVREKVATVMRELRQHAGDKGQTGGLTPVQEVIDPDTLPQEVRERVRSALGDIARTVINTAPRAAEAAALTAAPIATRDLLQQVQPLRAPQAVASDQTELPRGAVTEVKPVTTAPVQVDVQPKHGAADPKPAPVQTVTQTTQVDNVQTADANVDADAPQVAPANTAPQVAPANTAPQAQTAKSDAPVSKEVATEPLAATASNAPAPAPVLGGPIAVQTAQVQPNGQAPAFTMQQPVEIPTQQTNWPELMIEEISKSSVEGMDSIEMTLTPEKLGRVQIQLEMKDGAASVRIVTETADAARLFNDNQQRLSDAMNRAGLDLTGHQAGQGQTGGQGNGANTGPRGLTQTAEIETPTDTAAPQTATGSGKSGIDLVA